MTMNSTSPRIVFVILHFGAEEVTKRCVRSIRKLECQEWIRILIMDNDAADARKPWSQIYNGTDQIQIIQSSDGITRGFSSANNMGYRAARQAESHDYIILCNNDGVFPQKDFAKRLVKLSSIRPCEVIAPRILRARDRMPQNPLDTRLRTEAEAMRTIRLNRLMLDIFLAAAPSLLLWEHLQDRLNVRNRKKHRADYLQPKRHIVPSGACLIFTASFIERESCAFEPETEFYYEEYLLALRCSRKGYEILYEPSLVVLHEEQAATKERENRERERLRFRMEQISRSCEIYLRELRGADR